MADLIEATGPSPAKTDSSFEPIEPIGMEMLSMPPLQPTSLKQDAQESEALQQGAAAPSLKDWRATIKSGKASTAKSSGTGSGASPGDGVARVPEAVDDSGDAVDNVYLKSEAVEIFW